MVSSCTTLCYSKHVFDMERPQLPIICANCGGYGHGYKSCNHPIISYGIICYRLIYDHTTNSVSPRYLMVQRKDSLCYVEFIRGKYEPQNKDYLMKLFNNMTEDERLLIRTTDFHILWDQMWCRSQSEKDDLTPTQSKSFTKEFKESVDKFNMLKKGFLIRLADSDDLVFFDINHIIDITGALYNDTEWGFPKGRRNISENDLNCALREFSEETGIATKNIRICYDIKPIEEIFSGSNKIRYKHVYFVAKQMSTAMEITNSLYNPANKMQSKEVKDVRWFTYQDAQDLIREHNVERKELFKRLNSVIMRTIQ
jgi:8-oxo-dGTP pyrophosphatase MutT (NUDIX family)